MFPSASIYDQQKYIANEESLVSRLTVYSKANRKAEIKILLHYQKPPFEEVKLIRCTRGSVYSVVVDLRPNSPTYKQWESIVLSENEYCWRYIPEVCANGIQALEDDTELIYQVTQFHAPESEAGIRWNDPVFQIKWPLPSELISKKDQSWKDFLE